MTRPTDPTRGDALQPDERALARELQPAAPDGGPSAALDAAILASAREAAAARTRGGGTTAPRPAGGHAARPRRRRHAAWLGGGALAATLVIAVGVSWQMQPRFAAPGIETTSAEAPVATAPVASAARPDAPAAATGPRVDADRQDGPGLREAPPVVFDAPAPQAAPVPAPAPPARAAPRLPPQPPPAPPAPVPAAAPAVLPAIPDARAEAAAKAARDARARTLSAEPVEAGHADDHATEATGADQPLDDIPPASVDSPEVRDAWLDRIRELVAAGRSEEARESLAEFQRRHPDATVPDDLQSLPGQ